MDESHEHAAQVKSQTRPVAAGTEARRYQTESSILLNKRQRSERRVGTRTPLCFVRFLLLHSVAWRCSQENKILISCVTPLAAKKSRAGESGAAKGKRPVRFRTHGKTSRANAAVARSTWPCWSRPG